MVPLVLLLIASRTAHAQILDLDANGLSDVWELVYGVKSLDLTLDADRDGVPNRLEAVAGTDPFNAVSVTRISEFRLATNGASVTFNVILNGTLGKRFDLQANESFVGGASHWTTKDSVIPRTNTTVTLSTPADLPSEFFRISVADVDTDGDGLSDWEEYMLGLDPLSPFSNGQADATGNPLNDYRYVAGRLVTQSLASLLSKSAKEQMLKRDPTCGVAFGARGQTAGDAPLPSGTGLTGEYFTNASATYTNVVNFNPANLFLTTNNPVIDFVWGPATAPNLSNGNYTVRWNGQVEPQYSELYFFEKI
jgi:hypothetical protein